MAQQEDVVLSWQAPEFTHYEKNMGWYITLVSIAGLIVVFEFFQKDIFGGVSIAIIAAFILFFSRQKPETVTIKITRKGVYIQDTFTSFETIKYFWIVDNENHHSLNFETTSYLNHTIIIELADQDPAPLKNFLLSIVPERPRVQETLTQKLRHTFKF